MKPLSILLISALSITTCFAQNKADSLKAAAVFGKSANVYAHLKTYTDLGKVTSVDSKNTTGEEKVFKTAYSSTGDFNFEYYVVGQPKSLYTINRTGKVIKTWWGITAKESESPNISRALGAAAGVSGSSSYLVPTLLLTTDFTNINTFTHDFYRVLKGISIKGNEDVNGLDCFKIEAHRGGQPITIWIAKKDYLIRKIEMEYTIDPSKTEPDMLKAIADLKAKGHDYAALEKAVKLHAEIRIRDSLSGHPQRPYVNKSTCLYFPTANGNINPDLLKFRPNRVAGS